MTDRIIQIAAIHATRPVVEEKQEGNRVECGCLVSRDRKHILVPCPQLLQWKEQLERPPLGIVEEAAQHYASVVLDNDPPRCNQCGREPPTHAKHCPKTGIRPDQIGPLGNLVSAPAFKLEMHGAEGDAMHCIFNAITEGATFIVTGPNSVVSPSDTKFGATLEDATGEIDANAYGSSLGDVLIGLVTEWRTKVQLQKHQAQHDSGAS